MIVVKFTSYKRWPWDISICLQQNVCLFYRQKSWLITKVPHQIKPMYLVTFTHVFISEHFQPPLNLADEKKVFSLNGGPFAASIRSFILYFRQRCTLSENLHLMLFGFWMISLQREEISFICIFIHFTHS